MKLYEHQKAGLEAVKDLDHVAFYWDMGLGKTFAGSEKMVQLGARVNLIVCQKSKVHDWIEHVRQNYTGKIWSGDLTDKKDFELFLNHFKNPNFLCSGIQLLGIINYDLIWRRKELLQLKDFTLLLDESSLIQNETAKRSKFILKLKPKNVILLSGTPTGGKYERLWSQMHLLGWNISKDLYWKQFIKVEYLDSIGRSIPIVTGYKNVDRLKRKMNQYGCQFLKTDEVFDLPSQTFSKVRIPASKEYRIFKKDRIVDIEDQTLVGDTTLTKMLAKRYGWTPRFEPVDNNPYLEDFYGDMKRWSFNLQIYFLNKRFREVVEISKSDETIIQDRTIFEDARIFAPNLHGQGYMSDRDFDNYTDLFDLMMSLVKLPDLMIYIRSSIPNLISQIEKRGREYEQSIRIDYLTGLNNRYEEWIKNYKGNIIIIDGDTCKFGDNPKDFQQVTDMIDAELFGLFSLNQK